MLNFFQRLFGVDPSDDTRSDVPIDRSEGTTVFVVDDEGRVTPSRKGEVHDISPSSDFAGEGGMLTGSRGADDSETERALAEDARNDAA